jgi:hypothetical protein
MREPGVINIYNERAVSKQQTKRRLTACQDVEKEIILSHQFLPMVNQFIKRSISKWTMAYFNIG